MRPLRYSGPQCPPCPASEHNKKVNDFLTRPREKAEAPKRRSALSVGLLAVDPSLQIPVCQPCAGSPQAPNYERRVPGIPMGRLKNHYLKSDYLKGKLTWRGRQVPANTSIEWHSLVR